MSGEILERVDWRERGAVYADRAEAGGVLAGMVRGLLGEDEWRVVLAIPTGGVPVAEEIARELGAELDVAVAKKVSPLWNAEVGYGAVAFDGSVMLNAPLIQRMQLDSDMVEADVARTRERVAERVRRLRGERAMPDVTRGAAVLVDDGLASGFTAAACVAALRRLEARRIIVAASTASLRTAQWIAELCETVVCPNVRSGLPFAVADAYRQWRDVEDDEAAEILRRGGA